MGKQTKGPLPAEVDQLRVQLQEWRRSRKGSAPIPPAIWDAAIPLANQFGVCRISRAVGMDYTLLRKKVALGKWRPAPTGPTFVEVPAGLLLPAPFGTHAGDQQSHRPQSAGVVVEISNADGARMRMCLEGSAVDAAGIVAAFLGQR